MIIEVNRKNKKWVRSTDGWFAGVFEGLGKTHSIDPNVLRLFWFASVFLFGSGLFLYLILALVLPREDKFEEYQDSKFLGVCKRISQNYGVELGLVRLLAVASLIISFGLTFFGYLVLWIFLPEKREIMYL